MATIEMVNSNQPTFIEMVKDGFSYLIYDWKEYQSLIDDLARLSQSINTGPISFRVIDMKDDAYHVVFAPFLFSVADARLFIKLSQ